MKTTHFHQTILLFMLFCMIGFTQTTSAATITVTNTHDAGTGSLRWAVGAAQNGDMIVFSKSIHGGVISLFSEITINREVRIVGPGADKMTISGRGANRIFYVVNGNTRFSRLKFKNGNTTGIGGALRIHVVGANVEIIHCVFENNHANYGGAIYFYGVSANPQSNLILENCTFIDNTASQGGAINTWGILVAEECEFLGNSGSSGGAIHVQGGGTAIVSNSSFENNEGSDGGAMSIHGIATISRCTFTDNEASVRGGAMVVSSASGTGQVVISHSTLINNQSQNKGGAIHTENNLRLESCSVIENTASVQGGGIYVFSGTVEMNNSILATNTAPSNPDGYLRTGTVTSDGHNFIGNRDGWFTPISSDISGSAAHGGIIDPLLEPLANNGGKTLTCAPSCGSPVRNMGYTTISTDQRGMSRNAMGAIDIGAVEFQGTDGAPRTRMVTTTSDNVKGSLRRAVDMSCDTDHIKISSSLHNHTVLLTREIVIDNDLTISGYAPYGHSPVYSNGSERLFSINPGTTVAMDHLMLRHGMDANYGGLIYNRGSLTMEECTLRDGEAYYKGGGIYTLNGTLSMENCEVAQNESVATGAAAIYGENATMTIAHCDFHHNSAGGINNENGSLTLTYSAMHDNNGRGSVISEVSNHGDATSTISFCSIYGNTRGIYNQANSGSDLNVYVTNTTISGNSCTLGAGIHNRSQTPNTLLSLTLSNCTITENNATSKGGGLSFQEVTGGDISILMANTILAGNTSPNNTNDGWNNLGAPLTSLGYNLIGDTDGFAISLAATDIAGSSSGSGIIDPRLDPLADNGGATWTHALKCGSPAINAGGGSVIILADQRGMPRIGTGSIDIGAVEVQPTDPFGNAGIRVVTNTLDSGAGSLREAIAESCVGDTIQFGMNTWGKTITMTSEIAISHDLLIEGPANGAVALDGNATNRIFNIARHSMVTLQDLTFQNGSVIYDGGAIRSEADLTLTRCTFTGNEATGGASRGGAVYNLFGDLTIAECEFEQNEALEGGAVYNHKSDMTITKSKFMDNHARGEGGGVYQCTEFIGGSMTMTSSVVANNTADTYGGGIVTRSYGTILTANLNKSTISGNEAQYRGGGIHAVAGIPSTLNLHIESCTITDNDATQRGGGINFLKDPVNPHNTSAPTYINFSLKNALIAGNTASLGTDISAYFTPAADNFVSHGFNLIGDKAGFLGILASTDIAGDSQNGTVIDPQLGPLADNGGNTLTHTLSCSSPAKDAGHPLVAVTYDQRGEIRTAFGSPDIGAFELQEDEMGLPTTHHVNTHANAGVHSLRTIVANACVGDTIVFSPLVAGYRIDLTSEIVLDKDVVIMGGTSFLQRISGSHTSRIFKVAEGVQVTLIRISLEDANATASGGAILNEGDLTLIDCKIDNAHTNGSGGAIYNGASTLSQTVSLTAHRTLFSNNSASLHGGAVYNRGSMSGVNQANFVNCTFSNNQADKGGAIYNRSAASFNFCTLTENMASDGGGIYHQPSGLAPVMLSSTIVAGNMATSYGDDGYKSGGAIQSGGYNLIGNNDPLGLGALATDLVGTASMPIDANLDPLADNGGYTWTHALGCGSIAQDAGIATTATTTDQRGMPRVAYASADIGAFEDDFVSDGLVTNLNDNGPGSLRQKIADACEGDTIRFDIGLKGGCINLINQLNITRNLVIEGPSNSYIMLNGGGLTRHMKIATQVNLTISCLTFVQGNSSMGGAIMNQGVLTAYDCTFKNNLATLAGGVISNQSGIATLVACTMEKNNSNGRGGAVDNIPGILNMSQSTVKQNHAHTNGGFVFNQGQSQVNILETTIEGNTVQGNGGAIYTETGSVSIEKSTVYFSAAEKGAIFCLDGDVMIKNSTISSNTATYGGGIYNQGGQVELLDATVAYNSVEQKGGGLYNANPLSVTQIKNTLIAANDAVLSSHDVFNMTAAAMTSFGHNLIGNNDGCSFNSSTGDQIGTPVQPINPKLGPLAMNGGSTRTHALLEGSPAIDAGMTVSPVDQRDSARPAGTADDIGAFEAQPAPRRMSQATLPQEMTAFPNPFKDQVTLELPFSQEETVQIALYDITGQLLQTTTHTGSQSLQLERLGELPAGTYIVVANTATQRVTQKIVKAE